MKAPPNVTKSFVILIFLVVVVGIIVSENQICMIIIDKNVIISFILVVLTVGGFVVAIKSSFESIYKRDLNCWSY